jgi:hypothetical protein
MEYNSKKTRFFSFDMFMGDAPMQSTLPTLEKNCTDNVENLRDKFGSNLPSRMLPKTFGIKYPKRPIFTKAGDV